jgi:pyridoxal phosphate enzyme (YggS family)
VSELIERLRDVRERIDAAARAAGRSPSEVRLIAVSKTFPAAVVREAIACGQRAFGESRVQEAARKIPEVGEAPGITLEWHLVGRLQRNKARRAVELFDVIHSVDRPELARALARAARALGLRPRVLIQVDLDDEPQKGGVAPSGAAALLEEIEKLDALEPVGLMAIPRACDDAERMRPSFARLRDLRDELNRSRPGRPALGELSMGMTADFEAAIREGATWVRVGTAIFGERERP